MTGSDAVGWSQPGLQKRLLSAVKRSGAVSPATRARERSSPVRMPRIPAGMTTRTIVTHWGAPRDRDHQEPQGDAPCEGREVAERHDEEPVHRDADDDRGNAVQDVGGV